MSTYETVIGLEVHVQLKTTSKIFCSCSTLFGEEANSNTCPVCLGLPGTLPVLNKKALDLGMKAGLALDCTIAGRLKFDRKNYFYPDLPKAYQISQYDMPLAYKGSVEVDTENGKKVVGITRAHLEEDAGKLLHEGIKDGSYVDYNRTGTPLLEIVSEPDIRSPEEAYQYLIALKAILEYAEVSDCNMEEGSLRCDANISLRLWGQKELGTKVEIKNLNSFKAVQRALEYEEKRQQEVLEDGGSLVQETRLWNDTRSVTVSMRSKEEAHDYRYFPEPDLVPFTLSRDEVKTVKETLPELPRQKKERFIREYALSTYDASVLVQDKRMADFFEDCLHKGASAKGISNWIQNELLGIMNSEHISWQVLSLKPAELAELLSLIDAGTISGKIAKEILPEMICTGEPASAIVKKKGLEQESDTDVLNVLAEKIIAENAQTVQDYKGGKKQALGRLVGCMMKETKGKANPQLVNKILKKKLQV